MTYKPTQLPTLSEMGNEYQPKGSDVLQVGSKDRYDCVGGR